jgi:hypothetical protein
MGRYPGKEEDMSPGQLVQISGMLVSIVLFVMLFSFLIFAHRFKYRNQEREAFYKSETLRRITETSGEGAKAAIELLREDERLKQVRRREGLKIAGVINIGVGLALAIFVEIVFRNPGIPKVFGVAVPAFLGLFPGLIGVALLVYVYFMAAPVE